MLLCAVHTSLSDYKLLNVTWAGGTPRPVEKQRMIFFRYDNSVTVGETLTFMINWKQFVICNNPSTFTHKTLVILHPFLATFK